MNVVEEGVWEIIESNDHLLLENSFKYFDKSTMASPYHTIYESL